MQLAVTLAGAELCGTQGLTTHTEIGAAVRRLALPADMNQVKGKLELFLPGRTTFVFDLDDDFGDDLPTQVRTLFQRISYDQDDIGVFLGGGWYRTVLPSRWVSLTGVTRK